MKIELHECDRCGKEIRFPDEHVWNIPYCITESEDYGREGSREICGLCLEALRAKYAAKPIPAYMPGVIENEGRIEKERKQE